MARVQPIINIQECDHCGWSDLGLTLQRKLACRHLHDEEPGVDQKHPDCDNPPDYILQSSGQWQDKTPSWKQITLIISREKELNWITDIAPSAEASPLCGFLIVDIFVVSEVATSISFANLAFSSSHTVNLQLIIPSKIWHPFFSIYTMASLKMQKWKKCSTSIWTNSELTGLWRNICKFRITNFGGD